MRTILVAEDDPASRELLREILEDVGYQVVEAANGREALEKIEQVQPHLVILDLQMPVLDGFGVVRQLRQDERFASLPVVALTAYAMRGDREKILGSGFTAYLAKPVDANALRTQVEQLLA